MSESVFIRIVRLQLKSSFLLLKEEESHSKCTVLSMFLLMKCVWTHAFDGPAQIAAAKWTQSERWGNEKPLGPQSDQQGQ